MLITIRPEQPGDEAAIYRVNVAAFQQSAEAELVNTLRDNHDNLVSLVAVADGQIVGHIMFSPVIVEQGEAYWQALGLAPMSVHPDYQDRGIGSGLVEAGLQACLEAGHLVVVVLGHPEFYSRFGFVPSYRYGIHWEIDCPPEAFMVAELVPGALENRSGIVEFLPEFENV